MENNKRTMDDCRFMASMTGKENSPLMEALEDIYNPDRANKLSEDQKKGASLIAKSMNKANVRDAKLMPY